MCKTDWLHLLPVRTANKISQSWLLDKYMVFLVSGNKNMLALVWLPFRLSGDVSEYSRVEENHKFFYHLFEELHHLAYGWQNIRLLEVKVTQV